MSLPLEGPRTCTWNLTTGNRSSHSSNTRHHHEKAVSHGEVQSRVKEMEASNQEPTKRKEKIIEKWKKETWLHIDASVCPTLPFVRLRMFHPIITNPSEFRDISGRHRIISLERFPGKQLDERKPQMLAGNQLLTSTAPVPGAGLLYCVGHGCPLVVLGNWWSPDPSVSLWGALCLGSHCLSPTVSCAEIHHCVLSHHKAQLQGKLFLGSDVSSDGDAVLDAWVVVCVPWWCPIVTMPKPFQPLPWRLVDPAPGFITGDKVTRENAGWGRGLWGLHLPWGWLLALWLGQDTRNERKKNCCESHTEHILPHDVISDVPELLTLGSCQ